MTETLFPEPESHVVSVLLPLPLPSPYDYLVPEGLEVGVGAYVEVPLGPRVVTGVVWGPGVGDVDAQKLKPVEGLKPAPPMPKDLMDFVDWVADYTYTQPGSVLALTMRSRAALEPPQMTLYYRATGEVPERMTAARARVLEVAADGMARSPRMLCEEAGVSSGVVKGLIEAGALQGEERPLDAPYPPPQMGQGPKLSKAQQAAADVLCERVRDKAFSVTLLDGVTGSGKTEVYLEAVEAALQEGRQALVLLPEIALTLQLFERFERRFGSRPAVWHSGLSQKERRRVFAAVHRGEARVVIGARSALFLPMPELGLLVIDEEHDASFKQEDGVVYHARDMGAVRGSLGSFPVVLASATPSLETLMNVEAGKYDRLVLKARHGAARLPEIDCVDMRQEKLPADRFISNRLAAALEETLAQGEQAMLFLNRRGYAPLTLCRTCGHRMMSPDSSSWLVEHRFLNRLVCHHSGFSMEKPKFCPNCGAEDSLHACGPGVERLSEEVATLLPEARTAIMSSDLIHNPEDVEALIAAMEAGEIDLLIGTQMMAKGHHFPQLTLVGVVDADLGLKGGDLRAAERTYQMLHQVAGRAGREEKPGRVLIQTYMPEHDVMQALTSGGRDAFLSQEASAREMLNMPPFGRLVGLVLSGPELGVVEKLGRDLVARAPRADAVRLMGPAPAPIALLRGRHRVRLLLKAPTRFPIQSYLHQWLDAVKLPPQVRLRVDVDPYRFL
ncbi:MAG: primosomal protein N' [Alphaproteobacteria bacterium]|nr:MAG: primosomal protein N' [Alphaproteobacteria bacterium]